MHRLARLDHRHIWHPFTQMKDWLRREPIVIASGRGAVLRDTRGREYLDANSSIWTNLHGHQHPKINAAIQRQLRKISHSSALGLANEPASLLAERLVEVANPHHRPLTTSDHSAAIPRSALRVPHLPKVFFSDDGSTALEVALKLAFEFTRRTRGRSSKPRFLSLAGGYHGDTLGAVSLGHIDLFHQTWSGLLFKTDRVMAPYCYRCPFNRAKPGRADARTDRKCHWECVGKVEQALVAQKKKRGEPHAAFVLEPLIQGAAGMIPQPSGWLGQVTGLARSHGALILADEVMTGFGRTGFPQPESPIPKPGSRMQKSRSADVPGRSNAQPKNDSRLLDGSPNLSAWCARGRAHSGNVLQPPPETIFACHHEGVQPDFLCLAKGLTGGCLPMAATLTTQAIFDAFLGRYEEFKTFFHGHSYTGNQLGAAAGLASLDLLKSRASVHARARLQRTLRDQLEALWTLPNVGDIRQAGLIAGIELVKNWRTREPFELRDRVGIRVCEAMARRGVLTRPIGNVIVIMPPYCTTAAQAERMVDALADSIREVLPRS